jgi:hypothetical protein
MMMRTTRMRMMIRKMTLHHPFLPPLPRLRLLRRTRRLPRRLRLLRLPGIIKDVSLIMSLEF